jgi:hypothetical protein
MTERLNKMNHTAITRCVLHGFVRLSFWKRVITEKGGDPGMVVVLREHLSQFPKSQGWDGNTHMWGGFGKAKFQLQPTFP